MLLGSSYLDRAVTIDEDHKDSDHMANAYALRQIARWGLECGVPTMIAGNVDGVTRYRDGGEFTSVKT